jgi:signal peptidase I
MKWWLRDIAITAIIAVMIFLGLQFTVQSYIITQNCMEPNFHEGQRLLVNKVVYKFHEPERGDVIILKPPQPYNSEAIPFIKRIIALPGETVEVKNGEVYINGVKLSEPYIKEPPNYTLKRELNNNEYFVLGDNRNNANDSHTGWTLPRENIVGKAWLSTWPPSEWGLAANYSFRNKVSGAE